MRPLTQERACAVLLNNLSSKRKSVTIQRPMRFKLVLFERLGVWGDIFHRLCQKCMRARLIKYVCSFLPTQFAINFDAYMMGAPFVFHVVVPIFIWRGARPSRCHSVFLVCKGYIRRSPFFHDIFCVSLFTLFLFIASFPIVMNDFMND